MDRSHTVSTAGITYLCQAVDETLVYVNISQGSYRLWRGDGATMVEEPVLDAGRLRHGTTFIDTDTGTFWAPGPGDTLADSPCWVDVDAEPPIRDDQKLIELDPAQYKIAESPRGLVISRQTSPSTTDGVAAVMMPYRDGPAMPHGDPHPPTTPTPLDESGRAPGAGLGD